MTGMEMKQTELSGTKSPVGSPVAVRDAFIAGENAIIRMQDSAGRGPWRPGFSHKWMAADTPAVGEPIFLELPNFQEIVAKAHAKRLHIGCGVRVEKTAIWFTPSDISRLAALGFRVVDCSSAKVIAETKTQVLIASPLPLKFLPEVRQ